MVNLAFVVSLVLGQPALPGGGAAAGAVVPAPAPESLLTQWPASERGSYLEQERALNAVPTAESLKATHVLLASEPHVAGTEGDAREIERLRKTFADLGLEVTVHEFWPYLCYPVAAQLDIVRPDVLALELKERALKEDAASADPNQNFGWNAYSGSGDVTAGVVYANFGTKADFAQLKTLGVDVKGKIVVARYGGNFRGYKARFAEEAGAAGLIIYTDPADSGYMKGLVYPEGGYANDCCIQRGSIITLPYQGDPLTPGTEATKDAARVDRETVDLPRIPVQPVGWAAAKEILSRMQGSPVPEGWQGGLPFPYRVTGGDELQVHLKVEQKREVRKTANVIGVLRGSKYPDQMMIVGAHHDAWNCGASDPLCGTIAMIESAKSFAALKKAGHGPERTIVFAAWGAEEYGIIGSTEWVEGNREKLMKNAVGYINLDMASMGTDFNSSASPTLRGVIAAAAGVVPQPSPSPVFGAPKPEEKPGPAAKWVIEAWHSRSADFASAWGGSFGDLGGGSDHVSFVCYAGVPCCTLGGGGYKGWSYHSTYDTLPWYWRTVGADYASALMVTRMTNAVASRMANAPLLPLDPARVGVDTRHQLEALTKKGNGNGLWKSERAIAPELAKLEGASIEFEARAARAMTRVSAALEAGKLSREQLATMNGLLLSVDRAWLDDAGLPGRPWYKSLYAAPDEDSGYASWILPGLCRAVEEKNAAELETEQGRCLKVFEKLDGVVDQIGAAAP
jgi:N-acetylated-alpha-linked acidic dipeptidase